MKINILRKSAVKNLGDAHTVKASSAVYTFQSYFAESTHKEEEKPLKKKKVRPKT